MRVYFLVEGKRTESKVYVSYLSYLVPELTRIAFQDDNLSDSYFLISAEGYPSIICDLLPASIEDVNRAGNYNYLVVSLDADETSVQERVDEINDFLSDNHITLRTTALEVIVQNRCIETWFLGNRRVVNRFPTNPVLQEYLRYYDVRVSDPERMGRNEYGTHAQFHLQYLREVFSERGITYSKKRPGHVLDKTYLDQLLARINDEPNDLSSLQVFLNFCRSIREEISCGL